MKLKYLPILLALHLLILVNIGFTAWPEMLSYPYLISNGFKLYTDFIHPYPPLLTLLLTGFYKIFGFNIPALKFFTWSFILASDVFLFLIVQKILKSEFLSFLLLVPYVLLQSFLDGNMLWFDNALVLPVVAGAFYLLNWSEKKKQKDLILAGAFLTIGVFVKQTAALYFLPAILFTSILRSNRVRKNSVMSVRLLVIPVIAGLGFLTYLALTSSLKNFWQWSLYYPFSFWSKFPGYVDLSLSFGEKAVLGLMLLPLLGAVLVRKKIAKDNLFILVLGFLAASLIAVYPRFSYFHLQPTFAVLFIAFALIFSHLKRLWYFGLIAGAALLAIYPVFNQSFVKSVRFFDEDDKKVAKMVSALSTKDERVYLVGLFSSVYAFADRLPPKPWADNFGWYWEVPGEAEKILARFEQNSPDKIFYQIPERGNWFDLGVYRPRKLVNYMYEHYYRDSEPIAGVELWRRKD